MVVFFAEGVDGGEAGFGGNAHAGAVDVLAQAVAADVLLVAVEVGIGECGCGGGITRCGSRGRHRQVGACDADGGGSGRVAVGLAVGVVGGGLDKSAVRADDV